MSMQSFGTGSKISMTPSAFTAAKPVSMSAYNSFLTPATSAQVVRRSQMSDIKMSATNMAASRQMTHSLFLNNARPVMGQRSTSIHQRRAAPLMAAASDDVDPVFGKYKAELMETAKAIVAPGKGILAGDESNATIGNRFEALGIPSNHEMRQAYREMLFSAPGIEKHISGCIMFDETARDSTLDGKPFIELLKDRGIYSGIKVDTGVRSLGGTDDEFYTQGLDGLGDRAAEYYAMGCRFAKWRATIRIGGAGSNVPSESAIKECAHTLARYAMIMQQNGLVPIVEPEILQDGDHDIETCAKVSERVLAAVMKELINQHCLIEGLLLKPNMVTPGNSYKGERSAEEVAWYTVRTLSRTMAPAMPGVTFLSGGTSEEEASTFLNAMQHVDLPKPWALTFSYGRALQTSVMKKWAGKKENNKEAQAILLERATANGVAQLGKYEGGSGSKESDFVANYRY